MNSLWAIIKASRSGAYFMKALQSGGTGDLRSKWKEDKNWKNRVLLSGVIAAATIAIAGRTIYRSAKKANAKRKKRQQEKLKSQPVPQLKIYDDFGGQTTPTQSNDNSTQLMQNQPVQANVKPVESSPQIINEYDTFDEQPTSKEDEIDRWFNSDMIINSEQYLLSRNLINMNVDEINNKRPNSIKIKTSIGDWYINGSGIWTDEHETIFNENDKYKTLRMSKLLRQLKRAEYQDMFTIFETFDVM